MGRSYTGPNGCEYFRVDEGGARRWAMISRNSLVRERLQLFLDPIRRAVETEMELQDLNVRQLARASSVDPGHLRRWLMGWSRMSSDRVARLFTVLELEVVPTAELAEQDVIEEDDR